MILDAVPTLYVDDDELVLRAFEREVAEGVGSEPVHVRDEARVGVVLDVVSLYEVLHTVQRTSLHPLQLYDVRLEKVHLWQGRSLGVAIETLL